MGTWVREENTCASVSVAGMTFHSITGSTQTYRENVKLRATMGSAPSHGKNRAILTRTHLKAVAVQAQSVSGKFLGSRARVISQLGCALEGPLGTANHSAVC